MRVRLTDKFLRSLKPWPKPYRAAYDTEVPDLFVRVQPSGVLSWNVLWTRTTSKSKTLRRERRQDVPMGLH